MSCVTVPNAVLEAENHGLAAFSAIGDIDKFSVDDLRPENLGGRNRRTVGFGAVLFKPGVVVFRGFVVFRRVVVFRSPGVVVFRRPVVVIFRRVEVFRSQWWQILIFCGLS